MPHIPVKTIFGNRFPKESFHLPTCNEERLRESEVAEGEGVALP